MGNDNADKQFKGYLIFELFTLNEIEIIEVTSDIIRFEELNVSGEPRDISSTTELNMKMNCL